jgi:hypothetical protein
LNRRSTAAKLPPNTFIQQFIRQAMWFIFQPCRAKLRTMTQLLEDALAAVRNLPPADKDNIARVVLRLAGADDHRVLHGLTPAEPFDVAAPGFRDVLVVTFRREDAGAASG